MRILELGCGNYKGYGCPYEGLVVGVDMDSNSQADVIWDLEQFSWMPFKDNEFDAIYAHHCLEHLEDTVKTMDEIWRITKPNGRIFIVVPFGVSAWALCNPTHKKFFNITAINSFSQKFKVLKARYNYIFEGFPELQSWKGRMFRKVMRPLSWLISLRFMQGIYEKFLRFYIGDADEIEWELQVIK